MIIDKDSGNYYFKKNFLNSNKLLCHTPYFLKIIDNFKLEIPLISIGIYFHHSEYRRNAVQITGWFKLL